MPSPLFITIEGVDGAGKSTHLDTVQRVLEDAGHEVMLTREPGGTEVGKNLRAQLKTVEMDQTTAALVAFADRNEHLVQKILPALAEGKAVVSDRFTDSTYAYQGGGDGCDWGVIQALEAMVQKDLQPDLTLFFDLAPEIAAARREKRKVQMNQEELDKFDEKPDAWFENVRNAYLDRVREAPDRFITIDASRTIPEVAGQVENALAEFLARHSPKASRSPRP